MIVDIYSSQVLIVTINYNGLDDTRRLLEAIDSINDKVAMVVVDNDSKIRPHCLKDEFPKVELVLSEVNGGFGYGNNLGVSYCVEKETTAEYVFILNNDTVVHDGCIPKLLGAIDQNQVVCVSPLIVYPDLETIWFAGGGFSFKNVGAFSSYKDQHISSLEGSELSYSSPFLSGCAMFMRVSDYTRVNGFDERYFMYVEDVDLSYRLNALGRLIVVKDAVVVHHAHASLGKVGNPLNKDNENLDFYVSNVIRGTRIYIKSHYRGVYKLILFGLMFVKWQRNGARLGFSGWKTVNKYLFR